MRGITWFTEEGKYMLERLAPLTQILDKQKVAYELVESSNPGKIIYKDKYQVGTI